VRARSLRPAVEQSPQVRHGHLVVGVGAQPDRADQDDTGTGAPNQVEPGSGLGERAFASGGVIG
jgi:hypothetical protein